MCLQTEQTGRLTDMADSSHESKVSKTLRFLLSFALFGMISLLTVSICAKSVFLNPQKIEKNFTSYEYVDGVRESIINYANDIYIRNGLSSENLDKIFEFDRIEKTVSSYVSYNISSKVGYTNNSYTDLIDEICFDFDNDLKEQIKNSGQNGNSEKEKNISESVREFFKSEIDIAYIENIKSVLNIGSVAATAVLCVSAFFAVAIGLILFFIGTKRYRSVRAIASSFMSAGIFNLIISVTVYIISTIKNIDIYPNYLYDAFMRYFYACAGDVAFSGGMLIFISLIIVTAGWKIKKGS